MEMLWRGGLLPHCVYSSADLRGGRGVLLFSPSLNFGVNRFTPASRVHLGARGGLEHNLVEVLVQLGTAKIPLLSPPPPSSSSSSSPPLSAFQDRTRTTALPGSRHTDRGKRTAAHGLRQAGCGTREEGRIQQRRHPHGAAGNSASTGAASFASASAAGAVVVVVVIVGSGTDGDTVAWEDLVIGALGGGA